MSGKEWCVMHPSYPQEPHRGPMSEANARSWVAEIEAGGVIRKGLFYVAERKVGPWLQTAHIVSRATKNAEQSSAVPSDGDAPSGAVTNATGWPPGEHVVAQEAAPLPTAIDSQEVRDVGK